MRPQNVTPRPAPTGFAVLFLMAAITFTTSSVYSRQTVKTIVINEVVTDPQQDWNDTAGGNGVAFDNMPGTGSIGDTDEWVELFNAGTQAIDLTGWTMDFINGSNSTLLFSTPASGTVLRFSAGGSVTNFQPGEYLVIGNPPGAINNDIYIVLKDAGSAVVDDVEIGDDFEGDGSGDGAPDGGSSDGNASGVNDEAVARFPKGADTGNDVNDFAKQAATIGASNGELPAGPFFVVINEVVADPQQDWSDNAGGNGVEFDNIPGNGSITDTDEWVELHNAGANAVNLAIGSGWSIEFLNGSTETLNFSNPGSTVLRFSAGGSATNFQPGEYLVIGNPPGAINNNVFVVLKDAGGAVVDDVEIGDDFESDGNGDGAPDGGSSDGNATGVNDEAIARVPNAVDSGNDVADFTKQTATIGATNDLPKFCELSVTPTSHDFGAVEIGLFADKIFTLANAANATDDCIGSAGLSGDANFTIISGQNFSILPGGTHEIVARFDCRNQQPGQRQANLQITSNDPDVINVPLTGECLMPDPCQADFVASARFGIAPFTVEFTNLSIGSIDSYLWDFGGGTTSTEKNPKHTYNIECVDPQFTVCLIVRGPCGENRMIKKDYILVHPSSACAFFACPTGGEPPLRVGFLNPPVDYATGYLWNFGDGTTSTEPQPVYVYTTSGRFNVSLTIQTELGTATATLQDYINVQPHFVAPAPLLALNGPDFSAKSTGGEDFCGWNLWSNGFIAHDVTISGDKRWLAIEVVAAGAFAGGDWPKLQLLIDDVLIGEQTVAHARPRTYHFVAPLSAGNHTIKLAYPNDFFDPATKEDRNLIVTKFLLYDSGAPLSVPGNLKAAAMTIKSHGEVWENTGWNLFSNGFLGHGLAVADSGKYELSVRAAAHDAEGEAPKLVVLIDGVAADTVEVPAGPPKNFIFPLTLAKGNHLLQLAFINNAIANPTSTEDRNLILHEFSVTSSSTPVAPQVVINEIVTDPQRDWNDSAGGNGMAFDRTPGSGTITDTDEWLELFNAGSQAVDLTEGAGWSVEFINGTTALLNFKTPGSTVLRFSAGGAATNFKACEYLVIGNPPGSMNNSIFAVLRDGSNAVADDVELGDDFENDGNGDGAPDGGADGGNATSPADEAVARAPNAVDTGNDIADFAQQLATIGFSNDSTGTPTTQVKNATPTPPNGFVLYENHPNPFNPATKIKFSVPEAAAVVLTIHNLKGQEVARLIEGELAAGEYERDWNAAQHVTGIYFVRLAAVGKVSGVQANRVQKMLLAK